MVFRVEDVAIGAGAGRIAVIVVTVRFSRQELVVGVVGPTARSDSAERRCHLLAVAHRIEAIANDAILVRRIIGDGLLR